MGEKTNIESEEINDIDEKTNSTDAANNETTNTVQKKKKKKKRRVYFLKLRDFYEG
jgi:hypothetical protein